MTKENTILHMILRREELKQSVSDLDEDIKAFDMAIEALETGKEPEVCNNVIFEGTNMAAFGGDAIMGEFQNDIQSTQPKERDLKAELLAIARWYSMPSEHMVVIREIVDILEEVENEQEIQSDGERLLRLHTRRQITI